jgi:two-component system, OmpR family, phosphate regulon response regulator PhoB
MSRLLLVEDDVSLGETLRERLEKERHEVVWVETLADAADQVGEPGAQGRGPFDLIILDVNLPDGSGFEFARKVKSVQATPFIFVTAMNSAEHRLLGYEIGAEEFVPKPFHLKELLLRVRHVLDNHAVKNEIRLGDKVIDLQARAVVSAGGQKDFLATRDFDLLKLLIDSTPAVVSRDEILDRIWGEDKFPSHRTVDNSIVRLRQAIGDNSGQVIRSVRGVGYQWIK